MSELDNEDEFAAIPGILFLICFIVGLFLIFVASWINPIAIIFGVLFILAGLWIIHSVSPGKK